jgi:hypothetical protein
MGMYDQIYNVQNVGPGKTAIVDFPCSVTYDKIHLLLGGGLLASDITQIVLKANGKTFTTLDGAKIVSMQDYKGIFTQASGITLDFTEPKARGGAVPQYMASIPANLLSKLTAEITIAATANALSTLECSAEFRGPTQNPYIRKVFLANVALPIAGQNDIFLPNGVAGGLIKRIWMFQSVVTNLEIQMNRTRVFNQSQAQWQEVQKENQLVPQTGLDVVDFIADGNMQGIFNTAGQPNQPTPEVMLRVTASAAGSMAMYLEYIDPINRL